MRRMMQIQQADIDRVYEAIYTHLKRTHNLPNTRQLIRALRMNREDIKECITKLRQQERIEPYTLLPTDFGQRWRELPPLRDPLTAQAYSLMLFAPHRGHS